MQETSKIDGLRVPVKDKVGLKGVYVVTKATLETPEQWALNDRIVEARERVKDLQEKLRNAPERGLLGMLFGSWHTERMRIAERLAKETTIFIQLLRQLNTICKVERNVYENIVPTVGRTMIANNLMDATPDNDPLIRWAEIGEDNTTPTNSDTALADVTNNYRNAIASRTNAANIGYASAFFSASEVSGTFEEAGIFADGSATEGTGILVSRVILSPAVVKSLSQTLTIDWTLTIS